MGARGIRPWPQDFKIIPRTPGSLAFQDPPGPGHAEDRPGPGAHDRIVVAGVAGEKMSDDITIKGWVLRETPSGMAIVFMPDDRLTAAETICLPKSQVAVVKGVMGDEVTMPRWLAKGKGLY